MSRDAAASLHSARELMVVRGATGPHAKAINGAYASVDDDPAAGAGGRRWGAMMCGTYGSNL